VEQVVSFLAISIVVIATPGPDTLLTVNNTLAGGRRAGIATALGVANGQAVWTVAATIGLSAILVASEPVFGVLKLAGATYLVFIGLRSVLSAVRSERRSDGAVAGLPRRLDPGSAYRRGLLSNLCNPKMAVFFSSLLPQIAPQHDPFGVILGLGLVFCVMTLCWLTAYAFLVARAGDVLRRGSLRRWLEGIAGAILVLLGIGLAFEPRRG
jgi:threonine/homoserine/homoserine lactone efflux protein